MLWLALSWTNGDARVASLADDNLQEVHAAHDRVRALAEDEALEPCVEPHAQDLERLTLSAERAWTSLQTALLDGSATGRRVALERLGVAHRRAQEAEGLAMACLVAAEGVTVEEPLVWPLWEDETSAPPVP